MLKNAWYTCVACAMLWFGSVLFFYQTADLRCFCESYLFWPLQLSDRKLYSWHSFGMQLRNLSHSSWSLFFPQKKVGLYFPNWMAYMIHVQGLECMKVCSERVWQTWRLHLSWMQLKAQHFERSILLQKQNMQLLLPGEATDSLTIGTPKCSLQINLLTEIAYISRSISAKKISDRVEFCCHS
jgi:hypothetical protein